MRIEHKCMLEMILHNTWFLLDSFLILVFIVVLYSSFIFVVFASFPVALLPSYFLILLFHILLHISLLSSIQWGLADMGSDLVSGVLFFQNGGYAHLTVPLGDVRGAGEWLKEIICTMDWVLFSDCWVMVSQVKLHPCSLNLYPDYLSCLLTQTWPDYQKMESSENTLTTWLLDGRGVEGRRNQTRFNQTGKLIVFASDMKINNSSHDAGVWDITSRG